MRVSALGIKSLPNPFLAEMGYGSSLCAKLSQRITIVIKKKWSNAKLRGLPTSTVGETTERFSESSARQGQGR